MNKNTLYIEKSTKLSLKNKHVIISNGDNVIELPFNKISSVIINNTDTQVSLRLLTELVDANINVMFCGINNRPEYSILKSSGMCVCSSRVNEQIGWLQDKKDILWSRVISNKINNQLSLLKHLNIKHTIKKVTVLAGDPHNVEGYVSRQYFNCLFGDKFRRDDDGLKINGILNYGYVVLTNVVARSIAAHGYLNQLGIHHDNKGNPVNFACDIVEVFRPLVDIIAYKNKDKELNNKLKTKIISILNSYIKYGKKTYSLIDAIDLYVIDLTKAMKTNDITILKNISLIFNEDNN